MTPHHMIEHLADLLSFSNGSIQQTLAYPPEVASKIKIALLTPGTDAPIGFKSPLLSKEGLPQFKFQYLNRAIENLQAQLDLFDRYFDDNPVACSINSVAGELTNEDGYTLNLI